MRRSMQWRSILLLVIVAMLGGACSRMPPTAGEVSIGEGQIGEPGGTGQADAGGSAATGFGDEGSAPVAQPGDGAEVGTTGSGGQPGVGGASGPDGSSSSGTTSDSPAGSDQSVAQPPGGHDGQAQLASGPGIEDRTIKVVFHEQLSDCADAPGNPGDAYYEKARRVMTEYTKFFNEFVLKEHGWVLDPVIVDDGGYYCPERQRAAALKIAKEIKPFAALGVSASAQGPVLADVVTREGILHIGINWQLQADELARHPYAWNVFPTAEKSLQFMVGWMERRIKGTTIPDRSTPAGPQVERVYGILGLDEKVGRGLAKVTLDAMREAGLDVRATYFVSPDTGVAAQQSTSVVAKMRQDGVNTLVWALQFGDGKGFFVPLTEAMDKQNYLPDLILGTGGNAFFEQLAAKRVWANAKGTSGYGVVALRVAVTAEGIVPAYDEINENSSGYLEAWKQKLGNNDNPLQDYGNAFNVWADLSALATGIINTGDTLNAQTWAQGLLSAGSPGSARRCTVGRFMGRDYKHVGSFEWDDAHDGGGEGFTTVYWVNKQTPLGTNGYWESYDNYLYFQSPDRIPPEPTHDTGKKDPAIKKQERIGIRPWKSCSEFPNYPK